MLRRRLWLFWLLRIDLCSHHQIPVQDNFVSSFAVYDGYYLGQSGRLCNSGLTFRQSYSRNYRLYDRIYLWTRWNLLPIGGSILACRHGLWSYQSNKRNILWNSRRALQWLWENVLWRGLIYLWNVRYDSDNFFWMYLFNKAWY